MPFKGLSFKVLFTVFQKLCSKPLKGLRKAQPAGDKAYSCRFNYGSPNYVSGSISKFVDPMVDSQSLDKALTEEAANESLL